MDPTQRRWIRNTLGVFVALALVFELLSLWSFTATYFARNQSVLFGIPLLGTFRLPPLVLILGLGMLVGAAIHYSERDDVPAAIEAFVRETGEIAGVLESSDIEVQGAITYDEVRWVSAYTTDGRITDVHRQCPRCRRDLTPAHVPTDALGSSPTASESETVGSSTTSTNVVRPASLLATVVQYSSASKLAAITESELVEAQACPHCEFAVAGTSTDASNHEAVRDVFQDHYTNMAGPNSIPADSLMQQARERLDHEPTPGDVWDEYVIQTGAPGAARINVVEDRDELTHVPVESYPALADLKSRADGINRALEMIVPDSLKPVWRFRD